MTSSPTLVDRAWRVGLTVAYRGLLLYWRVLRPHTFGVCVAVWCEGRVLLVRHSYKQGWSIPTGGRRRREPALLAAQRELFEETGIQAEADALRPAWQTVARTLGSHDHLEFFDLALAARPGLALDGREIVEARFATPAEALALELPPPVRAYLARRAPGGDPHPASS